MSLITIKRALISVSDKSGLDELADCLSRHNIQMISSGGTRKYLEKLGHTIIPIEEVTGNPESFGGRMKTLSFQVSSALLFRRDNTSDLDQAKELGIEAIDLVVCNLYPFEKVLAQNGELEELIENIDIGGPTMIRSAAKNFSHVLSCSEPKRYHEIINEINENDECTSLELRKSMALGCFKLMGHYDTMIATKLMEEFDQDGEYGLRYGENPHQKAWVVSREENSLANCEPIQGKKLSYNNYLDCDAAWNSLLDLQEFDSIKASCVIVKHLNPCGQAMSDTAIHALENAWASDPVSSFGSIVALNKEIDQEIADFLTERFTEVIMAPSFSEQAIALFSKKKNLRLIKMPLKDTRARIQRRTILGGELIQERDSLLEKEINSVTKKEIPNSMDSLISFGILTAKNLKSNAISLVTQEGQSLKLIGAGMGNPNRFVSIQQAIQKAKDNGVRDFEKVLLISDAFFPFADSIELAHEYGIKNIIQPGGSIKDKEVIAKCDELGIAMSFTGTRHFLH